MNLTRFGVWTTYNKIGVANAAQAARLAQDLGYGAFWLGGSPEVRELAPLLGATETLVVATGIVNIWKSDPAAVAQQAAALERESPGRTLTLSNYTRNLQRFGFTERDIADGGSDRLVDAVVPHGSAGEIAEVVHAHLEAGADHVCLQSVGVDGVPRAPWTALAGALGL